MIIEIATAKLSLIFVWMVEFFDAVVSLITLITEWAFLMVLDIPALLRLVETQRPSSVLLIIMVIRTFFEIVC